MFCVSDCSCARCVHIPVWRKLWLLLRSTHRTLLWPQLPGKEWRMYCNLYVKLVFFERHFWMCPLPQHFSLVLCALPLCSTTTTLTLRSTCTGMERSTPIFLLLPASQTAKVPPGAQPLQTHCLLPLARRKKTNPRIKLLNRYSTY